MKSGRLYKILERYKTPELLIGYICDVSPDTYTTFSVAMDKIIYGQTDFLKVLEELASDAAFSGFLTKFIKDNEVSFGEQEKENFYYAAINSKRGYEEEKYPELVKILKQHKGFSEYHEETPPRSQASLASYEDIFGQEGQDAYNNLLLLHDNGLKCPFALSAEELKAMSIADLVAEAKRNNDKYGRELPALAIAARAELEKKWLPQYKKYQENGGASGDADIVAFLGRLKKNISDNISDEPLSLKEAFGNAKKYAENNAGFVARLKNTTVEGMSAYIQDLKKAAVKSGVSESSLTYKSARDQKKYLEIAKQRMDLGYMICEKIPHEQDREGKLNIASSTSSREFTFAGSLAANALPGAHEV